VQKLYNIEEPSIYSLFLCWCFKVEDLFFRTATRVFLYEVSFPHTPIVSLLLFPKIFRELFKPRAYVFFFSDPLRVTLGSPIFLSSLIGQLAQPAIFDLAVPFFLLSGLIPCLSSIKWSDIVSLPPIFSFPP